MSKLAIAFTACVLALGLAAGASAQPRSTGDTSAKRDDSQRSVWSPERGALETKQLIGTRIKNIDGKDVGEIDQLVVNQSDGKITHAVIGKGGVLGVGETKLVVRWSDLKLQRDPDHADKWIAVVDQAKLDAAPRYEARKDRDTAPAASPTTTAPAKKY